MRRSIASLPSIGWRISRWIRIEVESIHGLHAGQFVSCSVSYKHLWSGFCTSGAMIY